MKSKHDLLGELRAAERRLRRAHRRWGYFTVDTLVVAHDHYKKCAQACEAAGIIRCPF